MTFLERWLRAHDMPAQDAGAAARAARERAARFPFPIGGAYRALEALLDRSPALLQRAACPAHGLDADAFHDLERGLSHHPSPYVRAVYTLLRFPALEALYPDVAPTPPSHPLEALGERIRAGQRFGRTFDAIVIGSGAGGAPVAWALTRSGFSVAIVEAGGLCLAESTEEALERRYLGQGFTGAISNGGMTLTLAGEAVGGTTVINSGTSLPPREDCLARWDAALGTDFAEGSLEPWVEAASRQVGVSVPDRALLDASADIVERGLAALGRVGAYVLPRNAPGCTGAGRCCFGCPTGAKLSTDRSFLPEAIERGATLFASTRASVIRERPDGVEVLVEGASGRRLLRGRHLVLAAGALSTPSLIRRNRLGSAWRAAGDGLKIHPASKVFALMPESLEHGGIPQGLGYRDPSLPRLTFEGVHTPAAAAAPMIAAAGRRHRWWMERYDRLATYGMMCRDRGAGSVRQVGGVRRIDYALHPEDAHDLGAGLLLVAEAFFAAGAQRVLLPLQGVEPEVASIDDLRRLRPSDLTPQRLVTCGFHPQGTAGMGRVVDADLRLQGCARTWVCDGSVLPDSPGVNPQITIMALALRCADTLSTVLRSNPPWASASAKQCQDATSSPPTWDRPDDTPSPSTSAGAQTGSRTG